MTRPRGSGQKSRWVLIVFATILTLCLLALTIFDYARMMGSLSLSVLALALLALLASLLIRLLHQTRGLAAPGAPALATTSVAGTTGVIIVSGLTLLATALRLYQLGTESFGYDETWTATWAARPLADAVQIVNPLVYVLAHCTLLLSRSEFILRFGPCLAGIVLIPVTYQLGRRLYGPIEGLLASGFLTVSLHAIFHSQDLRFYAWQMLFSSLTLHFLIGGLERHRWHDWAGFIVSTILNLYTHPYALFVLASEGIYTLVIACSDLVPSRRLVRMPSRDRLRTCWHRLVAPGASAFIALTSFAPQWSRLLFFQHTPRWVLGTDQVMVDPSAPHSNPWFVSPIAVWAYGLPRSLLSIDTPSPLFALLALFVLGLLASSRRQTWLVLAWLLLPLPILASLRLTIYFRYLSYFLPLIALVIAHGIQYLAAAISARPQKQVIALGLLVILIVTLFAAKLPGYYARPQTHQWRELIAFIEARQQPGDLVLVHSLHSPSLLPFEWYSTISEDLLPRQAFLERQVVTDSAQLGELASAVDGYQRVWFVFCRIPEESRDRIVEAMYDGFRSEGTWGFVGLELVLLETHLRDVLP